MVDVFFCKSPMRKTSERSWESEPDDPFRCSVVTANGHDFIATVSFLGASWISKSAHPQSAVDAASSKAGAWAKRFREMAKHLQFEADKPKPSGAPHGCYTMGKVPDSPEQEDWIRRKRQSPT